MVQTSELTSEDSETFKSGYKTVANIGKERIRRVIKKINEEKTENLSYDNNALTHSAHQSQHATYGFRVYKYEKSVIHS
jgi:adenine-specific DNA-methyltransferase